MRREQLEGVVRAQPFRPFRITLTNGQRFSSGRVYRQQIQAYLRNGR